MCGQPACASIEKPQRKVRFRPSNFSCRDLLSRGMRWTARRSVKNATDSRRSNRCACVRGGGGGGARPCVCVCVCVGRERRKPVKPRQFVLVRCFRCVCARVVRCGLCLTFFPTGRKFFRRVEKHAVPFVSRSERRLFARRFGRLPRQ